MNKLKLFDTHIHSEFSPDGRMKMEEAVESALIKGLGGISFTDHFDVEAPGDNSHFCPGWTVTRHLPSRA